MQRFSGWVLVSGLVLTVAGCSVATRQPAPARDGPGAPATVSRSPAEQARADSGRPAYTAADVRFIQGMIAHHAQAVRMARWAATHGASESVQILAGRIDVGQRDEIAFMQRWLRERRQPIPDPDARHDMGSHRMPMPGTSAAGTLTPGMLTPEQLAQLDAARGSEFDRLFLTFMIQHHEGALTMVQQLFSSPGAGQDVNVFRFASDVEADQTTEIERMRTMLATSSESRRP
jgi:uncharacterized protein (DUF305 family)